MIFVAGCGGLDLPDLTFSDDVSPRANLETSYEVVLDPNYSGYQDDDDLDRKAIEKGAKNFAECAVLRWRLPDYKWKRKQQSSANGF